MLKQILIIDKDIKFGNLLTRMLTLDGYPVYRSFDIKASYEVLREQSIDMVLIDSTLMHDEHTLYPKLVKEMYPDILIIMLTANNDFFKCIQLIKNGVDDCINKKKTIDRITIGKTIETIKQSLYQKEVIAGVVSDKDYSKTEHMFGFDNIIGDSTLIKEAINMAKRVARTDATILLSGETGTGKELFAKAIHNASPRNEMPFLALNCSSFSKDLLESELFGYVAGAFTGAFKDKKGLIEVANGGTLFLDEIGDMDMEVQVKLLRLLESGEWIKMGDTKIRKINLRIISATHKDLKDEVTKGAFREDLFYRLNIFNIYLPSLRDRKQDILLLANYYVRLFSKKMGKRLGGMTKEYESILEKYYWKGNIRELKNTIERSVILSDGIVISENTLPYEILSYSPSLNGNIDDTTYALNVFERLHIYKVLTATKWNKVEAAKLLNISVSTLYRKIEDYMLSVETHRS
ncbi:MAG TPA: sigma-54 dependent transcriptional regulator [Ferruginibacter sp.]|jgi:two-component system NtrC family response regulator|nr:sigma-54 dependent transcriptional regulator [Ferruginibacter sp.]